MTQRRSVARGVLDLLCALIVCVFAGTLSARASTNGLAVAPPLGWTSWSSMEAAVDEASVKAVALNQASLLKNYGYVYVNVDGGWYLNPDADVDSFGRWVADPAKFPAGMAALGDYIHGLGLKFGLYLTPGIPALAVTRKTPIENTVYSAADIAITTRTEITYLGGTMYYIDYTAPGSQPFVNSWANLIASWGVDYLKLDAVGDWNVADVRAWSTALQQTGRPIHLELSNSLDPAAAASWSQYANGWRISGDIESYNGVTITDWNHVLDRFQIAPRWLGSGGSGGWNDFDSLEVGSANSGLTHDERQTMVTLWALSASPLIVGDDLRTLDAAGLALITNPEVIGVDQNGVVAAPVNAATAQQVWIALEPDGSYVVGLFNLSPTAAVVTAAWSDLGFTGPATVRDLWARADLGSDAGGLSIQLAAHASALLRVRPAAPVRQLLPSAGAVAGWAALGSGPVGPRGQRAQYIGWFGGALTFPHVGVTNGGWYDVTITYVNGDAAPRGALVFVNNSASWIVFPAAGGWGNQAATQGITIPALLSAGDNRIAFWNPFAWAPDVAAITIQPRDQTGPASIRLVNVATNKLVDIALGSTAAGAPVVQWPASGAASQTWQVISNGQGQCSFINQMSAQAMDIYAATPQPGLPLVQEPASGVASQLWMPVATGTGAFVLVNAATGLVVHASTDWNGAKLDQSAPTGDNTERWIIVPIM